MEEKVFLVLRGIPGSGKTTFARKWVLEKPEERIRINWDDIRTMFGKYWVPSRDSLVVKSSELIIDEALKKGYNIVIDNTNIKGSDYYKNLIDKFNKSQEKYHYIVQEKLFNTDLETCIERDKNRDRTVGAGVITGMYNRLQNELSGTV